MPRIGNLVKRSGLSRSTLLYYDSIGLLCPSSRSPKGYRLYSKEDMKKLDQIVSFRRTGLTLEEIKMIFSGSSDVLATVLKNRLHGIGKEILRLKEQRKIIMALMRKNITIKELDGLNKNQFVEILISSELTSQELDRFHREFEKKNPSLYKDFLEFLGISQKEINNILEMIKNNLD